MNEDIINNDLTDDAFMFLWGRDRKKAAKTQTILLNERHICEQCGHRKATLNIRNGVFQCAKCRCGIFILKHIYPEQYEVDEVIKIIGSKYIWRKL